MLRSSVSTPLLLVLLMSSAAASAAAPYLGVTSRGTPEDATGMVKNTCSSCHGMHGEAVASAFPNLAGQSYNYLLKELEDFRSGARQASPMSKMIKTVPKGKGDQHLENLAAYFSSQQPHSSENAVARSTLERGRRIFQQGIRGKKVPACSACHMQNATGIAPMAVPALAGQNADYLVNQLHRFASGKRSNSPQHVMRLIAGRLDKGEMRAVAAYLQALRPADLPGAGPLTYAAFMRQSRNEPLPGVPAPAVKGQESGDE